MPDISQITDNMQCN